MADNITSEHLKELAEKSDERLDRLELNLEKGQSLHLAKGSWTKDSGDENFPYRYALTVSGVTDASRAEAVLDEGSIAVAVACGLCPVCRTAVGAVMFKSVAVPEGDLTGMLYIKKEAAMGGA